MDTHIVPTTNCVEFGNDDLISERFQQDGYVVVSNVLSEDEIESSINELWTNPRLLGEEGVKRDIPDSWKWSEEGRNHGFVDSCEQHSDEWCWRIRTNEKILSVFSKLLSSDQIVASNDRWGVLPPTKDICFNSNEKVQKPEWLTEERWLHWDQHPFLEKDLRKIQGLVTLTEHTIAVVLCAFQNLCRSSIPGQKTILGMTEG